MRKFLEDFTTYTFLPDGRMRLVLDIHKREPGFDELHVGERVLLILPGPDDGLLAIGTVLEQKQSGSDTVWIVTIPGMDAIKSLPLREDDPDAGLPQGYDGADVWAELRQRRPRLDAVWNFVNSTPPSAPPSTSKKA